jgi:YgiT-type zinc finger domain-containing protein
MSDKFCMYCQGKLRDQLVTRVQEYDGHWIVIENLPALVCEQCGERYYTPDAHDLVVSLVRAQPEPARTEIVRVYDAARAA